MVPKYNPVRHGPLQERGFAIRCGTRWEGMTVKGKTVELPDDHPQVQMWKAYSQTIQLASNTEQ